MTNFESSSDEQLLDAAASAAADRPPIIESFEISGLYGYRTLRLSSAHAATILIARNGSGKTTLLGALHAFLRTHFHRLADLDFATITCKLRDNDPLTLTSDDLRPLTFIPQNSEVASFAQRFGLDPVELSDYLLGDFSSIRAKDERIRREELSTHEVFSKIYQKNSYNFVDTRRHCERLLKIHKQSLPKIAKLADTVKAALGGIEIVYLPTYRRIELPLPDEKETEKFGRRKPSVQTKLGVSKRGLFSGDIYFGLTDIADRLTELNNQVQSSSNMGYRKISANIINELVDGTFEREENIEAERPSKEALERFFSRLRNQDMRNMYVHYSDFVIPDIDKIYRDGASSAEVNKFLQYFLGKLNTVISTTRDTEKFVEDFVNKCNSYLNLDDSISDADTDNVRSRNDGKLLQLDRNNLQVKVISVSANRAVPLDSLSSGEKQMISLFARLYLYEGEKIVLIDEPELSLSLDWQRTILPDIIGTPSCVQFIAITHSPFVFDNELEPYARSLHVEVNANLRSEREENTSDE